MGVEVDFESWLKAQGLSPEEIKRKADETEAAWEARLSLLKPGESLVRMPKDTAMVPEVVFRTSILKKTYDELAM
jgi:hypothetical protein